MSAGEEDFGRTEAAQASGGSMTSGVSDGSSRVVLAGASPTAPWRMAAAGLAAAAVAWLMVTVS